MADLTREFKIFHKTIVLTSGKKASLRRSRDAVRKRIRNHFQETLNFPVPKFRGQGSYAMGTTVNPINGEYDIDDGVYFQHLDTEDASAWPAATTVHQWLVNAVDGHTSEKPMDKRTCVRVRYVGQYHVDLPSYGEFNGQYLLAVKGETPWPHSDPLALTDWFIDQVKSYGEQLRRTVRYLKTWADFQSHRRGKMPSGLILTVLAANHFQSHKNDDVALANTLQTISNAVDAIFFVLNPVDVSEELTARLTDVQKTRFQEAVTAAAEDANAAVLSEDGHEASKHWRKQFGGRFPLVAKEESNGRKKQAAAGIAGYHAGKKPPKPWGWQ
ncbi:MAG: hypothetical protein HN366_10810 [Deltaproteobacteria bacterium]|jgi:hypothetical protein|nr:hypothetical protein [Deltaproteobacteria bacterium]